MLLIAGLAIGLALAEGVVRLMGLAPDVILVSIDTLRADHLSSYGYHRMTTPHLHALAEEGDRFREARVQVARR
ncbi:MAG: sulfatase-like hydrolase/transferase [Myxococcota bacterium]